MRIPRAKLRANRVYSFLVSGRNRLQPLFDDRSVDPHVDEVVRRSMVTTESTEEENFENAMQVLPRERNRSNNTYRLTLSRAWSCLGCNAVAEDCVPRTDTAADSARAVASLDNEYGIDRGSEDSPEPGFCTSTMARRSCFFQSDLAGRLTVVSNLPFEVVPSVFKLPHYRAVCEDAPAVLAATHVGCQVVFGDREQHLLLGHGWSPSTMTCQLVRATEAQRD